MNRQLQVRKGIAESEWSGTTGFPIPPSDDWTFVDVTERPEAQVGYIYDASTDTFTPPLPLVKTRVSKSQVVSALTPLEWAEMGKYHPTANAPYDDPDVYWGVTQFQLADYIDLADPRFAQILGGLVAKGLMSAERATAFKAELLALANA
jgi:hypothetical protein